MSRISRETSCINFPSLTRRAIGYEDLEFRVLFDSVRRGYKYTARASHLRHDAFEPEFVACLFE